MGAEQQGHTDERGAAGFGTLVLMLGTAAMVHLGAAPEPAGGDAKVDLPQAKHLIDLLDVLKAKTAGNLTPGETAMLEDLLFDLRMRYLEALKRA